MTEGRSAGRSDDDVEMMSERVCTADFTKLKCSQIPRPSGKRADGGAEIPLGREGRGKT